MVRRANLHTNVIYPVNLRMLLDLLLFAEFCSSVDCVSLSLSSVLISSLLWQDAEEEKWRAKLEEHQGWHCSIWFIVLVGGGGGEKERIK